MIVITNLPKVMEGTKATLILPQTIQTEAKSLWRIQEEDSQIWEWCLLLNRILMVEVFTLKCLPKWWLNLLIWFLSIMLNLMSKLNSLTLSTDKLLLLWWHHMAHFTSSLWWIFSIILNLSRFTTSNLNRWEFP